MTRCSIEPRRASRRRFLQEAGLIAGGLAVGGKPAAAPMPAAGPFQQRGYYITFMRMPTFGLSQWNHTIDLIQADGGNLLLLWMGGGFRSRKFPVTWRFNAEHENVRRDFARQLIRHAHRRGIRVLLGFTPFGYDGVNQYPLEHPELKALKKDGRPTDESGIYCWGWNLCPSKPASQAFMLEYVREMCFEFYPEADGLMIESSDYAICYCAECRGRFFDREFDFVRAISEEVWTANRAATVVVYPHYFSGAQVPGFDVTAASRPFDPRWTLFFTPHSAPVEARLVGQARASLWWDDAPALRDAAAVQGGAQRAAAAGVTGYIPSLEAYSFLATHREEGQRYLVGRRQVPLGFGWLKPGQMPFGELPIRANRIAYREFTREPNLSFAEFKRRLGREVFGERATGQDVEDLLLVQHVFVQGRSWCQASPLVNPDRVRAMQDSRDLKPGQIAGYRHALSQLREVATRQARGRNPGARELRQIAEWVLTQWTGLNEALLGAG